MGRPYIPKKCARCGAVLDKREGPWSEASVRNFEDYAKELVNPTPYELYHSTVSETVVRYKLCPKCAEGAADALAAHVGEIGRG